MRLSEPSAEVTKILLHEIGNVCGFFKRWLFAKVLLVTFLHNELNDWLRRWIKEETYLTGVMTRLSICLRFRIMNIKLLSFSPSNRICFPLFEYLLLENQKSGLRNYKTFLMKDTPLLRSQSVSRSIFNFQNRQILYPSHRITSISVIKFWKILIVKTFIPPFYPMWRS